jgi:hypothetical protein
MVSLASLLSMGCIQESFAVKKPAPPVGLFPFREGKKKWGYINRRGEVVIKPRFEYAHEFSEGLAHVFTEKGVGCIDEHGKLLFILAYNPDLIDWIDPFKEGLAAFSVNHKCGFFDRQGKVVIPPKFDHTYGFSEGRAAVLAGAKWLRFPEPTPTDGKWGFIDKTGRLVIPTQYDYVGGHGFSDGLALVSSGNGYAYLDRNGKAVLTFPDKPKSPKFDIFPSGFSEKLARVSTSSQRSRYGFIDRTGKFAIKPRFHRARDFKEGLAAVAVGEKWGYVNRTGRIVIKPRFEEAQDFSEGLAAIRRGKRWYYINKQGKVVIPPPAKRDREIPWNDVKSFSGGLARVHVGGTFERPHDASPHWTRGAWFYIDRKGKIVHRYRRDAE